MQDFQEWFNEIESYGLRSERFYDDIENNKGMQLRKVMVSWLEAAYKSGYEDCLHNTSGEKND